MSSGARRVRQEEPHLVDPPVDALVFAIGRARPGEADIPRFGDLRWQLAALDHSASGRTTAINWATFPSPLRPGFQRAAWAVINIPTPEMLLTRSGSASRPRLAPGTLRRTFTAWRCFAQWLSEHQVNCLAQVDRGLLEKYPQLLTERGQSRGSAELAMFAITRLRPPEVADADAL